MAANAASGTQEVDIDVKRLTTDQDYGAGVQAIAGTLIQKCVDDGVEPVVLARLKFPEGGPQDVPVCCNGDQASFDEFLDHLKTAAAKWAREDQRAALREAADVLFEHKESMSDEAYRQTNKALQRAHDAV